MKNVATAGAKTTHKTGRPRTGRVESWRDSSGHTCYRARITLGNGTTRRLPIPANHSKEQARGLALAWQIREDTQHGLLKAVAPEVGETVGAWFERFTDAREGKIVGNSRNIALWHKWIGPHLDALRMSGVTRAHIEYVRDGLDHAIATNRLRPKSASNVWSVLTKAFREAVSSKIPRIRCLDVNPCHAIATPDTGESRTRPWLYPIEMQRLLACNEVDLAERRVYALVCYTYMRPGELAALRWSDVNFETNVIAVRRATNWDTGESKDTKTRKGRRGVPIHPNLRPLLEVMRAEPTARVWPDYDQDQKRRGEIMRKALRTAGITRTELFTGTEDTTKADFRMLRTTGATWAAMSGLEGRVLERRIGHGTADTTDRYVAVAEDVSGGAIGEPFPPLPACILGTVAVARAVPALPDFGGVLATVLAIELATKSKSTRIIVGTVGIEPTTSSV